MKIRIIVSIGLSFALTLTACAQVPGIINYQGRITAGGTNFTGTGQFQFALVNATGTTTYWSNDGNSVGGSEPTVYVSLTVSKGFCSVLLGDTTVGGMTASVPPTVFTNSVVQLRVWFNDGVTGFQQFPDQRLAASGYALNAAIAANVLPTSDLMGLRLDIGFRNTLGGSYATIAGGSNNVANANFTTVGGGRINTSSNDFATVGGGEYNVAGGFGSAVDGGMFNTAGDDSSTVAGGIANIASGPQAVIGGGYGNVASGQYSTVAGGYYNTASGESATVGGGENNTVSARRAMVGGGDFNAASDYAATVGGGEFNTASNEYATIGGGYHNTASGIGAFVGGGGYDGLPFDVGNLASGAASVVSGGNGNTNQADFSIIGGGTENLIQINSKASTIGGGVDNTIQQNSEWSAIGGGDSNTIQSNSTSSTIGGGIGNTIQQHAEDSIIEGGNSNTIQAYAYDSTIGGGYQNQVGSAFGTIPGGDNNFATSSAFAAGHRAKANHGGSFVWADSNDFDFPDSFNNQFAVRCTGGAAFITGINGSGNVTAAANLAPGSGSWSSFSDRNAKENFQAVDARNVLDLVLEMPVSTWNYRAQDRSIRHLGPMAQDFYSAFHIGEDDKHITTVDEGGVALAAIQGLNEKLEQTVKEKDGQIAELRYELGELKAQMRKITEQVEQSKAPPVPAANVRNQGGM